MNFDSIEKVLAGLSDHRYIAKRDLATVIFLALKLSRPLYLEGEAGVGKTEVAKVLASMLQGKLIRLQCYEGLDIHNAVYEWDYARQILHLRMLEATKADQSTIEDSLYHRRFLIARPLLQAIESPPAEKPVLLIDEIDRADEEFESFLLELLSDFQITIPEIGTIKAAEPPVVVITSNRTREVHDALKRRCLYHWIDYPDFDTELQIVRMKVNGIEEALSNQVVRVVQRLRQVELFKPPGIAETLDWSRALVAMDCHALDIQAAQDTLGILLKYQDDVLRVRELLTNEIGRSI